MLNDKKIQKLAGEWASSEASRRAAISSLNFASEILESAGFVVLPKEELEAALKPFAKAATEYYGDKPISDETELFGWLEARHITWGDLRRAAALLAAITQETKS